MDNSVFSACAPYLDHFDKIGNELGIPPILLASFAMQESEFLRARMPKREILASFGADPAASALTAGSCDASVMGDNGGAYGLMQITEDKVSSWRGALRRAPNLSLTYVSPLALLAQCGDAPGGDCTNVDYNIRRGAEYFASTLSDNGGNLLKALGVSSFLRRSTRWVEG